MKKLLHVLLLVPLLSYGQTSLKTLRSSSEECKSVFFDAVNLFYNEVNTQCDYSLNNPEQGEENPFAEVFNPPRFFQCYLVGQNESRSCFQDEMNTHIRRNFRYPEIAQEMGIQGRVYMNFIITKCGNIENIRMRGPDKILEEEALRIVNLLPKLLPGSLKDGTPVRVPFSIPLTFRLQ